MRFWSRWHLKTWLGLVDLLLSSLMWLLAKWVSVSYHVGLPMACQGSWLPLEWRIQESSQIGSHRPFYDLASEVIFQHFAVLYCSHKPALIQCERHYTRAWILEAEILGDHLRSWLPKKLRNLLRVLWSWSSHSGNMTPELMLLNSKSFCWFWSSIKLMWPY